MAKLIDITGKRYGRLVVLSQARTLDGNARWSCRCDCGAIKPVYGQDLRRGKVVSCGCHKSEMASKRGTHHMSTHPAYSSWKAMRARCENPLAAGFELYGGRGVKICDRWQDFDAFWLDMSKGWRPKLSLDRFPDKNGDYEPGNVRWASPKQQADNRRNNRMIETPDGLMNVGQAAARYGIGRNTITARLRYGWTDPAEIVKPVMDKTEYLKQYRK